MIPRDAKGGPTLHHAHGQAQHFRDLWPSVDKITKEIEAVATTDAKGAARILVPIPEVAAPRPLEAKIILRAGDFFQVDAVERVGDELAAQYGYSFVGIDLSPAPFPSDDISIGGALESGGVERFGAPGTLYLAALVTRAIRRTRVRRCGFSGLMLPLLEDSVLARRAGECPPSLHELLLYSAVCGTGLDTIPLPGDISEVELAGIAFDKANSVAM